MIYYIDAKGESIDEYLASNAEYIGMLGSKTEKNITPADISLDKINERLKMDQFLVCCIMNATWWICILFNSPDGAKEIRTNHKGKLMLWYWMTREQIRYCMGSIHFKEFEKEFPPPVE